MNFKRDIRKIIHIFFPSRKFTDLYLDQLNIYTNRIYIKISKYISSDTDIESFIMCFYQKFPKEISRYAISYAEDTYDCPENFRISCRKIFFTLPRNTPINLILFVTRVLEFCVADLIQFSYTESIICRRSKVFKLDLYSTLYKMECWKKLFKI